MLNKKLFGICGVQVVSESWILLFVTFLFVLNGFFRCLPPFRWFSYNFNKSSRICDVKHSANGISFVLRKENDKRPKPWLSISTMKNVDTLQR